MSDPSSTTTGPEPDNTPHNGRHVKPWRRIITSHSPSDTDGSQVILHDEEITPVPVLGDSAHVIPLYSHYGCPSSNTHSLTSEQLDKSIAVVNEPGKGQGLRNGTSCQVTDLAPNFYVGMHRSSTVDYNVIVEGEAWLITPTGKKGKEGEEEVEEVLVKTGEMVIQRGTIHAWRAGPQGVRWYTVMVSALPVKIGDEEGKELADVAF